MKHTKLIAVLLVVIGLMASPLAHAQTMGPAAGVVKNFYAQLADTMKQGPQLGFSGRVGKLDPAVRSAFNLPLMTRLASGSAWSGASPDAQKRLVEAFSEFSVATYASRFTKYDGEKFEVLGEKPASGGGTIVETRLVPGDSTPPVTLNYLVRNDEAGKPRIVDVFLDASISELAVRRSEFTAIIKQSGFDALISSLNEKTGKMGV